IYARWFRVDRYCGCSRRWRQNYVEMQGLAQGQYHTSLPVRCEARVFHPYFISADSKLLRPKNTLLISRYGAQLTRERISYRDLHAGHRTTAAVTDSALHRSCNSRNLRGGASCPKHNRRKHQNQITPKGPTTIRSHLGSPFGSMVEERTTEATANAA